MAAGISLTWARCGLLQWAVSSSARATHSEREGGSPNVPRWHGLPPVRLQQALEVALRFGQPFWLSLPGDRIRASPPPSDRVPFCLSQWVVLEFIYSRQPTPGQRAASVPLGSWTVSQRVLVPPFLLVSSHQFSFSLPR